MGYGQTLDLLIISNRLHVSHPTKSGCRTKSVCLNHVSKKPHLSYTLHIKSTKREAHTWLRGMPTTAGSPLSSKGTGRTTLLRPSPSTVTQFAKMSTMNLVPLAPWTSPGQLHKSMSKKANKRPTLTT